MSFIVLLYLSLAHSWVVSLDGNFSRHVLGVNGTWCEDILLKDKSSQSLCLSLSREPRQEWAVKNLNLRLSASSSAESRRWKRRRGATIPVSRDRTGSRSRDLVRTSTGRPGISEAGAESKDTDLDTNPTAMGYFVNWSVCQLGCLVNCRVAKWVARRRC